MTGGRGEWFLTMRAKEFVDVKPLAYTIECSGIKLWMIY
jgi:hypothetical protein